MILATVPLWIAPIGLYPYLGIEILIWSIYALAFNLVLGTAGLPSFGHGAYFGIGAYASTLLFVKFGVIPWFGMAIGGVFAAMIALIVGWPCFRLGGHSSLLQRVPEGKMPLYLKGQILLLFIHSRIRARGAPDAEKGRYREAPPGSKPGLWG